MPTFDTTKRKRETKLNPFMQLTLCLFDINIITWYTVQYTSVSIDNSRHILTVHSALVSCLLNLNTVTCVTPATHSNRLSAQKYICSMAKGSSSGSGCLHLALSNSLFVFSLYRNCKAVAEASQNFKEPSAWLWSFRCFVWQDYGRG